MQVSLFDWFRNLYKMLLWELRICWFNLLDDIVYKNRCLELPFALKFLKFGKNVKKASCNTSNLVEWNKWVLRLVWELSDRFFLRKVAWVKIFQKYSRTFCSNTRFFSVIFKLFDGYGQTLRLYGLCCIRSHEMVFAWWSSIMLLA